GDRRPRWRRGWPLNPPTSLKRWRSLRWTGLPAIRPPPPRSSRTRSRDGPVLCRGPDYADVGWVEDGHGGDGVDEVGIIRARSRWFLHYKGGTRSCTPTAFTI